MKLKFIILMFFLLSFDILFAQCAMCKATLEADINHGNISAKGINNGILYLIFIPYFLIVTVGYFMYKHFKS